jgi:hypothetical protein
VSRLHKERLVEVKQRRQRRLTDDPPLIVSSIMSETSLKMTLGSRAVLHRQLRHLSTLIESMAQSLQVRILPFSAPAGAITGASVCVLLEFASPHLPVAAWQESVRPLGVSTDDDLVRHLTMGFDEALITSLGREESLELIEENIRATG